MYEEVSQLLKEAKPLYLARKRRNNQIKTVLAMLVCIIGIGSFYPRDIDYNSKIQERRKQLKAIGNAQSPFAAATAFRILLNRHIAKMKSDPVIANESEINAVFEKQTTWIKKSYPQLDGLVHTPTTMANYCCASMMKHQGCRNYKEIFQKPMPKDAEYLMGFPIGASSPEPQTLTNFLSWNKTK